jgi:hypothetical protein|tara:strand:+ start:297 stop:509 length:213 start_codon:yes stop_codon:yes gene_type:complete
MNEGNILSFKIMIDSKGTLVTELSQLPEEAVSKIFAEDDDKILIRKVIREGLLKLENLHGYLEKELQALR